MSIFFIIFFIIFIFLYSSIQIPIPISDTKTVRYNSIPFTTLGLIAINIIVFVFWQIPAESYTEQVWTYGARRDVIIEGKSIGSFVSFTAMFMHGGIFHITGNMIFLWAFGRRVEDACGSWRFLIFYLLVGTIAKLGTYFIIPSDIPSIGASGAISGVMGAYMLLFPGARIGCLWLGISVPRGIIVRILRFFDIKRFTARRLVYLPAFIPLIFYIGLDIIPTFEAVKTQELNGHVNYVAHAIGFLGGIAVLLFIRKDMVVRYFSRRAL